MNIKITPPPPSTSTTTLSLSIASMCLLQNGYDGSKNTGTIKMSQSFIKGKIVVITGSSSGIGKALAKAFSRAGSRVALLDIADCRLVAESLNCPLDHVLSLHCDVSDADQVTKAIRTIKDTWGRIDIYCSNAGILFPPINNANGDDLTMHSDEQWDKIFHVNVKSHVIAAREVLPDWERGHGDGIFLITASAAGLLTQIGDASYGVSKAAAVSFAEHMAIAHPTVQVHCLCPQAVDTPLLGLTTGGKNSATSDGIVVQTTLPIVPFKLWKKATSGFSLTHEWRSTQRGKLLIMLDGSKECKD